MVPKKTQKCGNMGLLCLDKGGGGVQNFKEGVRTRDDANSCVRNALSEGEPTAYLPFGPWSAIRSALRKCCKLNVLDEMNLGQCVQPGPKDARLAFLDRFFISAVTFARDHSRKFYGKWQKKKKKDYLAIFRKTKACNYIIPGELSTNVEPLRSAPFARSGKRSAL